MPSDLDLLLELDQALSNPGRLVVGPTDPLTGTYPFGGAGYGAISECVWDAGPIEVVVVGQSIGEVRKVLRVGERAIFAFVLTGWNGKLLQSFVKTNTTGQGYADTYRLDGGADPGVVAATERAVFVPDDRKGRAVLFRRPVPRLALMRGVAMSIRDPSKHVLGFTPTRSTTDTSTKRPWQVGRLEDLET